MDEERFWEIIETAGKKARGDEDKHIAGIERALKKDAAKEVIAFQRHFQRKMAAAHTWKLWGAAYLINGGCSDDGFVYFCAWLIGQGRGVYNAAVADPDTLADVVEEVGAGEYEFEDLMAVAPQTYEEMTGEPIPETGVRWPSNPTGREWDFDDDAGMARRFPRLWAMRDEEQS